MQAIRGAIAPVTNTRAGIGQAAVRLVEEICQRNQLQQGDLVYLLFSATPDLNASYPAAAVRAGGMVAVPMLCLQEMAVAGSLARCLRVLVVTGRKLDKVKHVYLDEASTLRPDWAGEDCG